MTDPGRYPRIGPAGSAIVERVGWDDDGRFTATLVFPNGPPELAFAVVWRAHPVRIVPVNNDELRGIEIPTDAAGG